MALNPKTTHFEFSGPFVGPIGIVVGLPVLTFASVFYFHGKDWDFGSKTLDSIAITSWQNILDAFSLRAFAVYYSWWAVLLFLHSIVPGPTVLGTKLRDSRRLPYKLNGWACFLFVHILLVPVHIYIVPLTWVCDNWLQLVSAMITTSVLGSFALYVSSFSNADNVLLAAGGNSGFAIYDFFIGRELNPRTSMLGFTVDWKMFCELRPGLWLWSVANIAFALKQIDVQGHVDNGMVLVLFLQGLYIVDSIWNESSILTTMDITDDGFGFMLCFGDLAWVPAMYSLQTRFLAENPQLLSVAYCTFCAFVSLLGFYIFRTSNAQKDTFRNHPGDESVRDLPFLKTKTGSRLLTGGWWGWSRHMNYFGDWLLALGMSLPTGFVTPVTYIYPFYFAILLIHRERRDHIKCAAKYTSDWDAYCRLVPYRIVPFVY